MYIALLKNQNLLTPITAQQKQILKYTHHHEINLDSTEIENSDFNSTLEERKEFRGFLRSLSENDHLIIFDLYTLSKSTDELIKIFDTTKINRVMSVINKTEFEERFLN